MAHRRRGVGVARGRGTRGGNNNAYAKKAEEMKSVSVSAAIETVRRLEEKLTDFAKAHREDIRNDPALRAKFLEMCGPLGVDPLSSEKSFWGKLGLGGLGEFYYELAVKVAEVCMAARRRNGGLMSVSEVKNVLRTRGTKFRFTQQQLLLQGEQQQLSSNNNSSKKGYSTQDIITAIGKLSKLGSGFRTVHVGDSVMIVSVPTELDSDHMEVMKIAQQESVSSCGMVTAADIQQETGWDEDRINRALDLLLGKGMAWLDVYKGQQMFWFPSIWKEGLEEDTQDDEE